MMRLCIFIFLMGSLHAAEAPKPTPELVVESSSQLSIDNKSYEYRTVAGNLVLKEEQGKEQASIFYTAYFLKGDHKPSDRPITFCFNGGPGAASVWLNIGFLGPRRIAGNDLTFLEPPYELIDNQETLLDKTDLVFIDPISTGISTATPGQDAKQFYGLQEDIKLMSDFIRLFTGKYQRWDSAKFLMGESYGGMRAAKVAYKLHDEYGYYFNGIVFISPALDLQTISLENGGNELPYEVFLPTYAAVARYHKQDTEEIATILPQVEEFVTNRYVTALFKGDRIDREEKNAIIKELSRLTTLPEELILRCDLRLHPARFMKELLQKEGKIVGRYDGRVKGIDTKGNEFYGEYDPSLDAVFGAMTGAYNQYLLKELKWPEVKEYRALVSLVPWNWGKCNQYASAIEDLRKLIAQNPKIKIFVASGIFDLAVPFYGTDYLLSRLDLSKEEQARLTSRRYPAGHMMYFNTDIRRALKQELGVLFNNN